MGQTKEKLIVRAQEGPQRLLLRCPAQEVFFGGQRGGGKSYGGLLDFHNHCMATGGHARGILFRQTYLELEDLMQKAQEIYPLVGARWVAGKKTWVFPNGGWIKMRHLEKENDANHYQGHEYTWCGVDEAGNYPSADGINKLRATLRSTKTVLRRLFLSGNPGGVGHNWLKQRYVDPAAPMSLITEISKHTGLPWTRCFIPARLADNKILMKTDPGYEDRIREACEGKPWLLKAWLEGLWNIIAGGMLDDIWQEAIHVIHPFAIPKSWRISRAYDHGSSAPFSCGWWAESNGEEVRLADGSTRVWPKGTMFRIAEWYGWNGTPNKGLKLLAIDIALGILARERALGIKGRVWDGPADKDIFNVINGTCIADDMRAVGVNWLPADKGPGSRKSGAEIVRERLSNSVNHPTERPGLYVFSTCRHWIRTVPMLPRDEKDPDDVDTNAEDHAYDETRYHLRAAQRGAWTIPVTGT